MRRPVRSTSQPSERLERLDELLEPRLVAEVELELAARRRAPGAREPLGRRARALGERRVDGAAVARRRARAPPSCAARSAARTVMPSRAMRRARRRRASSSGSASTARAWPSVSSPRASIQSTSSGSSSSRSRFETPASSGRPARRPRRARARTRRSATRRRAPPRRARGSRGRRSRRARAAACRGRRPRARARAASARPASRAARQRRSPAIELVAALGARPHDDRLQHALVADRRGEARGRLRLEPAARLARVRVDRVDREVEQLGARRRAADEHLETAAEAAARRAAQVRSTSSIATFQ